MEQLIYIWRSIFDRVERLGLYIFIVFRRLLWSAPTLDTLTHKARTMYVLITNLCGEHILLEKFQFRQKYDVSTVWFTDKRTDDWSRDFIIWKINSGLWSQWSGLDCEIKGSGLIMSNFEDCVFTFSGSKKDF